jgi:hypothetical protein
VIRYAVCILALAASGVSVVAITTTAFALQSTTSKRCGTVRDARGEAGVVTVERGQLRCSRARQVLRHYYRIPEDKLGGSGGLAKFGNWVCISKIGRTTCESRRHSVLIRARDRNTAAVG